jgi:hypothetical protein
MRLPPLLRLAALVAAVSGAPAQTVLLNELVTRNGDGLTDEEGRRPDWVELLNPGAAAVNLAGWGLSDDPAAPFRWRFPERTLAGRGRLVVFLSGLDRTQAVTLHANFRLAGEGGETLALTRPDGTPADAVSIPPLPRDVSYGRHPDGGGGWKYFASPTPRAANGAAAFEAPVPLPEPSRPGGFYEETVEVAWSSADPETAIHFTLDGSEPTPASPRYTAPIPVRPRAGEPDVLSLIEGTATVNEHTDGWQPPLGEVAKATVVRARAFRAGALPSAVATHTYFLGLDAARRYPLPVVSLATDADGLFDYDRGIYMLGRVFDEWRAAHPAEPLTGHTPANYTQRGPAWARPAHFEFYEPGGLRALAQDVALDIQGQSTRSFRQKPLGLKARGNDAPTDTFAHELFPGLRRRGDGAPLREFKNLRLRNGGNDWEYTLLRDGLAHRLAAPLGFDMLAWRPVAVFLNGEFWGVQDLREQQEAEQLEAHYGVPREDVVLLYADGAVEEGMPGDGAPFVALREFARTNDLAVPAHYAHVRAQADLDNFILYHAANVYFANADWPHNNLRVWRDRAGAPGPAAPPGRDGRWRWLLFDVDLGFGHPWSGGYGDPTLAAATAPGGRPGIDAPWSTLLFRALLANPDFRRDFVNTTADLLNSHFREGRARAVLDGMAAELAPVMAEHLRRWRTMGGTTNGWQENLRGLRAFAAQRPVFLRQHLVSHLGLAGYAPLTLEVNDPAQGRVRVNRLVIDADLPGAGAAPYPWTGLYFRGVPVEVEALPARGFILDRWEEGAATNAAQLAVTLTNATRLRAVFAPEPPHPLARGPYRLDAWDAASPAGTAPPQLRFEQAVVRDPVLGDPLEGEWTGPFNLTSRSRVVGLGAEGFAFLNTGEPQELPGAGYLGAATLALDTRGCTNISVNWTGGTVLPNQRDYALRLQYAVGDGPFRDVPATDGGVVEYRRAAVAGDARRFADVPLPAEAHGAPLVKLRWRYHFLGGDGGPRAMLRVDDILVEERGAEGRPRFTGLARQPDGRLRLQIHGVPGWTGTLLRSADLRGWTAVGAVTLTDGEVVVTAEAGADAGFFRLEARR